MSVLAPAQPKAPQFLIITATDRKFQCRSSARGHPRAAYEAGCKLVMPVIR